MKLDKVEFGGRGRSRTHQARNRTSTALKAAPTTGPDALPSSRLSNRVFVLNRKTSLSALDPACPLGSIARMSAMTCYPSFLEVFAYHLTSALDHWFCATSRFGRSHQSRSKTVLLELPRPPCSQHLRVLLLDRLRFLRILNLCLLA